MNQEGKQHETNTKQPAEKKNRQNQSMQQHHQRWIRWQRETITRYSRWSWRKKKYQTGNAEWETSDCLMNQRERSSSPDQLFESKRTSDQNKKNSNRAHNRSNQNQTYREEQFHISMESPTTLLQLVKIAAIQQEMTTGCHRRSPKSQGKQWQHKEHQDNVENSC